MKKSIEFNRRIKHVHYFECTKQQILNTTEKCYELNMETRTNFKASTADLGTAVH